MVTHGQQEAPSAAIFDDELRQVLAVLAASDEEWLSSLAVSHQLREKFGIALHWRTIDRVLTQNRQHVHRRKRTRRWEYQVLRSGRDLLDAPRQPVILVNPSEALQATMELHQLLASLVGTIRLCDPYLDAVTIEHLDACEKSQKIRLLTQTVRDSGKLRRVTAAARAAGYGLTIRVVTGGLHDRYVIDEETMTILGCSLNGFAKKQAFVVRTGADFRQVMVKEFDRRWAVAKPWP